MNPRVALYDRLPLLEHDRWWIEQARAAPGDRVLELGAASGRLTLGLAHAGLQVTAVERDRDMARRLEQRTAALSNRIQVVHADAGGLGERVLDGLYDLVALPSAVLNETEDLSSRREVVAAARRWCHPAGRVALQVLGPWWLAGLPARSTGRLEPADGGSTIEVTIVSRGFDAEAGRRRGQLTYRFADGVELHDDLDASVVTPAEIDLLLEEAGLELIARWGALPPAAVAASDPVWHLLARPRRPAR